MKKPLFLFSILFVSLSAVLALVAFSPAEKADPIDDYIEGFCECIDLLPQSYWDAVESGDLSLFTEEDQMAADKAAVCMEELEKKPYAEEFESYVASIGVQEAMQRLIDSDCGDKAAFMFQSVIED